MAQNKINFTEFIDEEDDLEIPEDTSLLKGPFINREMSWLQFNDRVLACANNKDIPLNERLKFLSISNSNLDEFISVRFAYAWQHKDKEPYEGILDGIKDFMENQLITFNSLKEELELHGFSFTKVSKLDKKEREKTLSYFMNSIFPLLTPINIGSTNEFPNFYSGQSCIVLTVKQGNTENLNIIPLDDSFDRIYVTETKRVIWLEDIVLSFLERLFVNKEIISTGYFRVIKDASIILNHDTNKFILERMNETILQRQFAKPIFMEISKDTPKRLRTILINLFDIPKSHSFHDSKVLDYTVFMRKQLLDKSHSYASFTPAPYEFMEEQYSIFSAIDERDILLHHPYDSYETIITFLEHAAMDPAVVGIKQTLYRVSSVESPIVNALVRAAKNGKHVSVLIEIKARFDESRNIELISKLKQAGVNVLLGLEYLKTHCKMCMVLRKEENGSIKVYSHLATGNYNEKTSKIYTDLSYFTAKQKIGMDLLNIFNILSGVSSPDEKLQKVFYAPVNLRKTLNKCIDREIENAKKGKPSGIFLKLNSLSDVQIVDKLYEAADAGVRIYIICRGVCSIVHRKNIYVKSIVGRFLEHSRIYCFKNNDDPQYFISSADLLTRNLDRRVETLISLNDKNVITKLKEIIFILKEDTENSFEMKKDGEYKKIKGSFNAHEWFIQSASSSLKLKIPKKKK